MPGPFPIHDYSLCFSLVFPLPIRRLFHSFHVNIQIRARLLFFLISYSFTLIQGHIFGKTQVSDALFFQETEIRVQDPEFSPEPGWYAGPQDITISAEEGAEMIIYTLDGSEPRLDNLAPSASNYLVNYFFSEDGQESQNENRINITHIYESPILLEDRSSEDNDLSNIITSYDRSFDIVWKKPENPVFKGQVIRAKAVKNGIAGKTKTATYFIHPEKNQRYTLPVLSLSFDPEDIFGYEKGIYVQGKSFFEAGGTPTHYVDYGNFGKRGKEWERPVHAEFFDNDGTLAFSQNLGMRIHGGGSRSRPMKSFRLYGSDDYDEHNTISYPFFHEGKDLYGAPMEDHKHLLVRMGGDFMDVFTDAVAHKILQPLKIETQRSRPVIHFFNGEYWGIANIRDRLNDHLLARKYHLDRDNLVILDSPWGQSTPDQVETDNPEDILLYRELFDFIGEKDLNDPENYLQLMDKIDLQSYVDYNIGFIYLSNPDWYGEKHFRYWRVKEPNSNPYQDGKWRFMVWDFDAAPYGGPEFNMLQNFIHPEGGGNEFASGDPQKTEMLRNLLKNDNFKHLFLNRFADHMNTIFLPHRVEPILQETFDKLRPELEEHEKRWHYQWASQEKLDNYIHFVKNRAPHQFNQLCDHLGVPGTLQVTLQNRNPQAGSLKINSVIISEETAGVTADPYPWKGTYFQNIPVRLSSVPNKGFKIDYWRINGSVVNEEEPEVVFTNDFIAEAVFKLDESKPFQLVHFWLMDTKIPNDTPLLQIHPHFNRLPMVPLGELIFHPAIINYPPEEGTAGIMDRVNDPTPINYKEEANGENIYDEEKMRGIRLRNPLQVLDENGSRKGMMELKIPSNYYEELKLTMAVSRTNNGPTTMHWEYKTEEAGDWIQDGLKETSMTIMEDFQLLTIDFKDIKEADNNPHLSVRFFFEGNTITEESGNVRFNNIAVEGFLMRKEVITSLPEHRTEEKNSIITAIYPNPTQSTLYIEFKDDLWRNVRDIEIIDARGVIIYQQNQVNERLFKFSLEGVPSGTYILKINTTTKIEMKRFIKQ